MNKQSLSTLPVCPFHPNAVGKCEWEYCLPERKMLMQGDFLTLPAACLAQSFVLPPAMARTFQVKP